MIFLYTFRMLATLNWIEVKFQSSEQNSLYKWELSKVKQSKCPLTSNVYGHMKGETNNWKKIWSKCSIISTYVFQISKWISYKIEKCDGQFSSFLCNIAKLWVPLNLKLLNIKLQNISLIIECFHVLRK